MSGYDEYGQQQGGGNYGASYEGERRGEGRHFGYIISPADKPFKAVASKSSKVTVEEALRVRGGTMKV